MAHAQGKCSLNKELTIPAIARGNLHACWHHLGVHSGNPARIQGAALGVDCAFQSPGNNQIPAEYRLNMQFVAKAICTERKAGARPSGPLLGALGALRRAPYHGNQPVPWRTNQPLLVNMGSLIGLVGLVR